MSSTAFASKNGAYIGVNAGISLGKIEIAGSTSHQLIKTPNYGAAIGYKFTDNFRIDFNISNRSYNFDVITITDFGNIKKDQEGKASIGFLNSAISLYYDIANVNSLTPYVYISGGASYRTDKFESGTRKESIKQITGYGDVGIGCKLDINDKLSFDARYKLTLRPARTSEISAGISYHF